MIKEGAEKFFHELNFQGVSKKAWIAECLNVLQRFWSERRLHVETWRLDLVKCDVDFSVLKDDDDDDVIDLTDQDLQRRYRCQLSNHQHKWQLWKPMPKH